MHVANLTIRSILFGDTSNALLYISIASSHFEVFSNAYPYDAKTFVSVLSFETIVLRFVSDKSYSFVCNASNPMRFDKCSESTPVVCALCSDFIAEDISPFCS